MKYINKLLSISTQALCHDRVPGRLGNLYPELYDLLNKRNGFLCFESALVVFPSRDSIGVHDIFHWNSLTGWRKNYIDVLSSNHICFAHDLFGGQFVASDREILKFDPEIGGLFPYAKCLKEWAETLLANYREDTAWPLAHDWQIKNRPLRANERLLPKKPFVLGGEYHTENLLAVESFRAMNLWGNLYDAIKNIEDGQSVTLNKWII